MPHSDLGHDNEVMTGFLNWEARQRDLQPKVKDAAATLRHKLDSKNRKHTDIFPHSIPLKWKRFLPGTFYFLLTVFLYAIAEYFELPNLPLFVKMLATAIDIRNVYMYFGSLS